MHFGEQLREQVSASDVQDRVGCSGFFLYSLMASLVGRITSAMRRSQCRSRACGISMGWPRLGRLACVGRHRGTLWTAPFCACGPRPDRSPHRGRMWSRRCELNQGKTSRSASEPPACIVLKRASNLANRRALGHWPDHPERQRDNRPNQS